jgi:hypothetical protein
MHYTPTYIQRKLKELKALKERLDNPCFMCGYDTKSTYTCDDCLEYNA